MRKITKQKIKKMLKKDSNYLYEKGDETNLYKKYKYLSFDDAIAELEDFILDDGVYFDFYCKDINKNKAQQKFEEFLKELPLGLEAINEDNIASAFINYRSCEALEKTREKEYKEIEMVLRLAIKEYSQYFNFRVN